MFLQALCVIICIVVYFYSRWLKTKHYWTNRGIPQIPPVPLLGSMTFLYKENFALWLRRIYDEFKCPYIGLWVFQRPGVIVNSPEIARNILVKDFHNFKNRLPACRPNDPVAHNLFTVDDPFWSTMRKHLNSVFTSSKLRMLQDHTRTKAKELVQRIHNDRKIKIDLKTMLIDYTTDVVGTSSLGIKSDATLTGGGPLREVTNDFSKYDIKRNLAWYSIFFYPEMAPIFRFDLFPKSSSDYFKKIFNAVALQRRVNIKDREARDLMDILLKIQYENDSYSDDVLIAQESISLLGGYESSANFLTFTLYELAHNAAIQEKLYQEIAEAAQRQESEDFDIETISKLSYLKCVVKEGFRKHMALTWVDRIAENDYKIDENLTIEAGTVVFINVIGMQYSGEYFPEPHKFDPDRFLPENKKNIEPYSYLPFGEGPRACIGKRFGLMTTQFALVYVLLNYKIRPCPNTPKPSEVEIVNGGILYLPAHPLHIEFVPRKYFSMFFQLVIAAIALLAVWLYSKWLKVRSYWAKRGVPHLPPVPILGSLTFLKKENFGVWLRRMNEQFKSPYIGIWVFTRPALIVNSPDIVRNILVRDYDTFKNRYINSGATDPLGGLNLFTVNEPVWSMMRKHLNPVFTSSKLRILQDNIRTKSKELVQRIHNDRNIKIDLKEMFIDYTTDVVGTYTFGVKSDATLTGGGPLKDITLDFATFGFSRSMAWFCIFFLPELVDVFRFKFFPKSSAEYIKKLFRAVASQRETNENSEKSAYLLDMLIKIQRENESYPDDLMISQAAIFFLAGNEATGTSIAYITYELAYHPDLQDKLHKELMEAVERNGSENFDMEVLSQLTYLNCIIKEGLRKYITLTWLDRVADKDYKIDDDLTIEAGTIIYINMFGIQHADEYYPDPYKFDPDRFLPENKSKIEPYSYLSFGEGPKACIGKRFGLMATQFALASMFLNYKVRPLPDMPKPRDIKIDNQGLLFAPAEILHVEFIPRQ